MRRKWLPMFNRSTAQILAWKLNLQIYICAASGLNFKELIRFCISGSPSASLVSRLSRILFMAASSSLDGCDDVSYDNEEVLELGVRVGKVDFSTKANSLISYFFSLHGRYCWDYYCRHKAFKISISLSPYIANFLSKRSKLFSSMNPEFEYPNEKFRP